MCCVVTSSLTSTLVQLQPNPLLSLSLSLKTMALCYCYKPTLFIIVFTFFISQSFAVKISQPHHSLPFIWPLPAKFTFGNDSLSIDPSLSLTGNGASSSIVRAAFDRYRGIVFKNSYSFGFLRTGKVAYDVTKLNIVVHSKNEEVGYFLFCFLYCVFLESFDFEIRKLVCVAASTWSG